MSSNSQKKKKKKVFLGSSKLQCGLHINIIYLSFMFQKVEHYERSITICLGDKHRKHFKPPQWASSILYFYHTFQNMIKTSSNWKASLNLAFDLMCNLDFFTPWHWNSTTISHPFSFMFLFCLNCSLCLKILISQFFYNPSLQKSPPVPDFPGNHEHSLSSLSL